MKKGSILLVPLGQVPEDLSLWLKPALEGRLDCQVTLGDQLPLQAAWYVEGRNQYHGTGLLRALGDVPRQSHEHVLGMADVDCYAPGLNFIFGQASSGSGVALVSLERLRPPFYGDARDVELFFGRVLKEAVHEMGHVWELGHCDNPRCVMHFSNTLADTDAKKAAFCASCRRQLLPR